MLNSGVVWCIQFICPTTDGSKMGTAVPVDWGIVPSIERLVCGSPRAPSSGALGETVVPVVTLVDEAGLVTTGLSGPPAPVGDSAIWKEMPRRSPPPLARSRSESAIRKL